jgi:pimeloyl-ACP methyl ester carboxylesterase
MASEQLGREVAPVTISTAMGDVEYAEFGQGPAVIALHGAMGGYDQSLILARMIGDEGYRYIAVSRPGYLRTPLGKGTTPEAQADLCAALLNKLGIDSAVVMAVSGGGPCAIHFALRHKDKCKGLVLVSTCGERVDTPIPFGFKMMMFLIRLPGFAKRMEQKAMANINMAAARSIPDSDLRERTLNDPDTGPLFKALLMSTWDRMPQRVPGTKIDINISRTCDYPLEQIAAPTLIVHGTADKLVPYEQHAKTLASRIAGAELLSIDGGEHVSIFTHRETVKPRVAGFLKEHHS